MRLKCVCAAWILVLALGGTTVNAGVAEKNERQPEQVAIDGYSNTPMQPGGMYHVHDPDRPQPEVADPRYDGKPVSPPPGAKVLFDGTNMDNFTNEGWSIVDGAMVVGKGNQKTRENFGDIHLHVEWLVPEGLGGWGQKRGNSGVFLMDKYEIQILDCWANRTYPDGMTGALYGQKPPLVNACRRPGEWQCYDIEFTAPVFEEDEVVSPAIATVYLNNVLVQDNSGFIGPTGWKRVPRYKQHAPTGPIALQSHGNPIRFRNIWVLEKRE